MTESNVFPYLISGALGLLWYLLVQKDVTQRDNIKQLTQVVDKQVQELHDLKLHVADSHYQKNELDYKFDKLETTFSSGFLSIGTKIDKLNEFVMSYITQKQKE